MIEIDEICREWIAKILRSHLSLIAIAARQRAKFEGWLKFELADHAERRGACSVQVEARLGNSRRRSDIAFCFNSVHYDLELKTLNANWRVPGTINTTRPITRNIQSVIADARRLRECSGRGIVAFVLFPVHQGDNRWIRYLNRIADALCITLSENNNCTRVNIPLGNHQSCDVIVCCFLYPLN